MLHLCLNHAIRYSGAEAAARFSKTQSWVIEQIQLGSIPYTRIGKTPRLTAAHIRWVLENGEVTPHRYSPPPHHRLRRMWPPPDLHTAMGALAADFVDSFDHHWHWDGADFDAVGGPETVADDNPLLLPLIGLAVRCGHCSDNSAAVASGALIDQQHDQIEAGLTGGTT